MLRLSGGGGVARRLAALAQVRSSWTSAFAQRLACSASLQTTGMPCISRPQLVAHAGPGRRWLASGGSSGGPTELPSLKAALRAVYRRVHPDLFQDHQPAKVGVRSGAGCPAS